MNRIAKWCMPLLLLMVAMTANAASREEEKVAAATDVIDQLSRIPEQAIPPSLLARAYAIAVIPNVGKGAFIVGYQRGRGVLVVRRDDNTWSNPSFIRINSGSFGWQWGGQSSDIILVFKTRKGVEGITSGKLTLGADASVAAGPVGRAASAATDIEFKAEVYSYSRSRGLFAGVSLEGTGVTMDRKANAAFYGSSSMTPEKIFVSSPNIAPDIANRFIQILTAQTARLPTTPGMEAGVESGQAPEPASEVRTFGMPEPGEPSDEPADADSNY